MANDTPQLRRIVSWRYDPPFPQIEMTTSLDIEKELWLLLIHVSEVRLAANKLFSIFGIAETLFDSTWRRFRAFIRQANNYWEVATRTNFRSSSLLYYYSFLNLVKAFILLRQSNLQDKVSHGLYYGRDHFQSDLVNKHLGVNYGDDQVFYLFYKAIFQTEPPKSFKIVDLFSYTTDISYQYLECGFGNLNICPVIHRICFDGSGKMTWSVLAIPKYITKSILDQNFAEFDKYFEFIPTPTKANLTFRDIFQFSGMEWSELDFYQFKKDKVIILDSYPSLTAANYGVKNCWKILKEIFGLSLEPNYFPDNTSFYIILPIIINNQRFPIHEDTVIYLTMFFMSELVRYQPEYLDKVLEDKEAWLFRSFVESCSLKFLRILTSRIKGQTIIMKRI